MAIFTNQGTATFSGTSQTAAAKPRDVVVADLNGDNQPDSAVSNSGSALNSVLLNNVTCTRCCHTQWGGVPDFFFPLTPNGIEDACPGPSPAPFITTLPLPFVGSANGTATINFPVPSGSVCDTIAMQALSWVPTPNLTFLSTLLQHIFD